MKSIKDFIKKNKRVLIIILVIIVVFVLLLIFVRNIFTRRVEDYHSYYNFASDTVEIKGSKKYSTDQLSMPHCLKDICISEVVFTYVNNDYGIQYVIRNNSSKKASGYLYMNYGDSRILLSYSSVEPGKTKRLSTSVHGREFKIYDDYSLSELTEEEKNKIRVGN